MSRIFHTFLSVKLHLQRLATSAYKLKMQNEECRCTANKGTVENGAPLQQANAYDTLFAFATTTILERFVEFEFALQLKKLKGT